MVGLGPATGQPGPSQSYCLAAVLFRMQDNRPDKAIAYLIEGCVGAAQWADQGGVVGWGDIGYEDGRMLGICMVCADAGYCEVLIMR